jgi:hypothetical protein
MEELSSIGYFPSTTDMCSSHGLIPYMVSFFYYNRVKINKLK